MTHAMLSPGAGATAPIALLRPEDTGRLRLSRHRRLNQAALAQLLRDFPDRSVWAPDSLEFALVAPWRHRPAVAVVEELAAVRQAIPLLAAVVENSRRAGDTVVLILEMDEERSPTFYHQAGMELLEQIITYDLARVRPIAMPSSLEFAAADPGDRATLAALIRIDHGAFPWLWWNSEAEFLNYVASPGTELMLGYRDGQPVSYFGVSHYPGWGHLDRIAVAPAAQGIGLGRQTLVQAINTLQERSARRIALSTQQSNLRSQRLYERFGFDRSPGFDYRLYGAPLRTTTEALIAPPDAA